jgi:transposase
MTVIRCGLDIAKHVFQVHGVDDHGHVLLRKTLARSKVRAFFATLTPCLVGIEACASAHYWGRELRRYGHDVQLMAAHFVSPYRKNGKNDANDAEAICEAVGRPNMRFVPLKTQEQQAILMVHRARELVVAARTGQASQIRGLLAEFGIVVPVGIARLRSQMPQILEDADNGLPLLARETLAALLEQFHFFDARVAHYDQQILHLAHHSEPAQRLMAMEGVGPLTATAIVASVGNARVFSGGRQFAAWLGLTPRQYSSGGRNRLGQMTKRGDCYLRTLLVHGARSVMRHVDRRTDPKSVWARNIKVRRHANVAAVALAAKQARVIWALLAKDIEYRPSVEATAA